MLLCLTVSRARLRIRLPQSGRNEILETACSFTEEGKALNCCSVGVVFVCPCPMVPRYLGRHCLLPLGPVSVEAEMRGHRTPTEWFMDGWGLMSREGQTGCLRITITEGDVDWLVG